MFVSTSVWNDFLENDIFRLLFGINVWLLLWRHILSMSIYSINILSVGLSIRLQNYLCPFLSFFPFLFSTFWFPYIFLVISKSFATYVCIHPFILFIYDYILVLEYKSEFMFTAIIISVSTFHIFTFLCL